MSWAAISILAAATLCAAALCGLAIRRMWEMKGMKGKVYRLIVRIVASLILCFILGSSALRSSLAISNPTETGFPAFYIGSLSLALLIIWKVPLQGKIRYRLLWIPPLVLGPWFLATWYERMCDSTEPLNRTGQLLIGATVIAIFVGYSRAAWEELKKWYQGYLGK